MITRFWRAWTVRKISAALTVVGVVVLSLTACGGTTPTVIVARVGSAQITNRALAEWMEAIAPGHFVPDPPRFRSCIAREKARGQQSIGDALREECAEQYGKLKSAALRFLITSDWLIAESKRVGRAPSVHDLTSWLAKAGASKSSEATRRLIAERTLAVHAAELEIRSLEAPISRHAVAGYYDRHRTSFERPERRYFEIFENIRTRAQALRMRKRLKGHRSHAVAIRETYFRPRAGAYVPAAKRKALKAIFAAPLGAYVGPVLLNGYYAIFRVTRTEPREVTPLTQAQHRIESHLAALQHERTLTRFLAAWESRWRPLTMCRAGYVIAECNSSARAPAVDPRSLGLS